METTDGGHALGQKADDVLCAARQLAKHTGELLVHATEAADVKRRVARRPYGAVGVALGVGLAAGTGVVSAVLGGLVSAALRVAAPLLLLDFLRSVRAANRPEKNAQPGSQQAPARP